MPTAAERMERKRKAKEQPKVDYYLAGKVKKLAYDYGQIPEEHREQVQRAALKIRQCERRAVEDLITIGQELMAVKAIMPDKFTEWIDGEFGYSNGSAHDFMNMARRHVQFPNFGNLGISSARLLSAPSIPDAAIVEACEIAVTAGKITLAQTREIIHTHKPPKPKQLPGPQETMTIDAEYVVMPESPYSDPELVYPALERALAHKLRDAILHRILKSFLTSEEQDQLVIALGHVLDD
jgi:hypothetical protein